MSWSAALALWLAILLALGLLVWAIDAWHGRHWRRIPRGSRTAFNPWGDFK